MTGRFALVLGALALAASAATTSAALPAAEGKLALLTWEGYAQRRWVLPFERATKCSVSATYARSSDDMARSMRDRGRFDVVSAGGDIAGTLIDERRVQPIDVARVPPERHLFPSLRSLSSVGRLRYGIATLWGPNLLLYRPDKVGSPPRSWSAIYDQRYRGKIAVPDNPLQIADAALYLGIRDPYELTRAQLDRAVALLSRQRPLVASYWRYATDEVSLFEDGRAWLGPGWSWQAERLAEKKLTVRTVLPREGVTGWVDSWMLAAGAKHPRCAYAWLRWISQPAVQAELAVDFGGSPASRLACGYMERIERGSCAAAHADSPGYVRSIRFWKTPVAHCGDGRKTCVDFAQWVRAWNELRS
jgi:putative spermidine/putrescine transport system substrate-binding protein